MTSDMQKIVAVIDDDEEMRESVAHLLSSCGYGTESFDSAEAFLSAVATSKAACLVVDIQLGNISGLEMARQLTTDGYKAPNYFYDRAERRDHPKSGGGCGRHCVSQ